MGWLAETRFILLRSAKNAYRLRTPAILKNRLKRKLNDLGDSLK